MIFIQTVQYTLIQYSEKRYVYVYDILKKGMCIYVFLPAMYADFFNLFYGFIGQLMSSVGSLFLISHDKISSIFFLFFSFV